MFRRPSWQVGVGAAASCGGRAIPDISAAGDLDNSPVEVWAGGAPELVGGTSVSTALIAGMAAVTNRYLSLEHAINPKVPRSMGFATPEIYRLANSPEYNAYYHDVLCGSNTFPVGQGWDEATGWGSIDWYAFTRGFAGQPVTPVVPAPTWACREGSGTSEQLTAAACPSKFDCFLGGASSTLINATDGWHWSQQGSTSSSSNIRSLACPSTQTCFALGSRGWLRVTTDSGAVWRAQRLAIGSPRAISCPTRRTCYVVGVGILRASDGHRFVRQIAPAVGSLAALSCPSAQVCYAFRGKGALLKTVNGRQWKLVSASLPGGTITAVSCTSRVHCVAVGTASKPDAQGGVALVYSTTDGTTWTSQVVGGFRALSSVSCSGPSACDAVSTQGAVLRTTDGGTTWNSAAPLGNHGRLNAVACPVATLCYAAGDNGSVIQLGAVTSH
jgi:photosystem II stability/assembly factor-like uncharacterized protein